MKGRRMQRGADTRRAVERIRRSIASEFGSCSSRRHNFTNCASGCRRWQYIPPETVECHAHGTRITGRRALGLWLEGRL